MTIIKNDNFDAFATGLTGDAKVDAQLADAVRAGGVFDEGQLTHLRAILVADKDNAKVVAAIVDESPRLAKAQWALAEVSGLVNKPFADRFIDSKSMSKSK
jgi:hypothetical protein